MPARMKMPEAGDMRHRVQIQAPVRTSDANGGVVITWNLLGEAWASIRPLKGRELEVARQTYAQVTHALEMRYRREFAVDSTMRVVHGSKAYNLDAVLNVEERNIIWQLMAHPNG